MNLYSFGESRQIVLESKKSFHILAIPNDYDLKVAKIQIMNVIYNVPQIHFPLFNKAIINYMILSILLNVRYSPT